MRELQRHLTARDFAEWRAYYAIEPFGEEPAHHRAALVASTMANIHRDPKKGRAFQLSDFQIQYGTPSANAARPIATEALIAMLKTSFTVVDKRPGAAA